MAHLPLLFDAQTKLNALKGPWFGRRIMAWKVINRLMVMKDYEVYDTYRKETVESAINVEIVERVLPLWIGIEA